LLNQELSGCLAGCEPPIAESLASGFTTSQASAPDVAKMAAVRKDASHPKCDAINGVSEAVTAPPI
jgi:hypothetical protein